MLFEASSVSPDFNRKMSAVVTASSKLATTEKTGEQKQKLKIAFSHLNKQKEPNMQIKRSGRTTRPASPSRHLLPRIYFNHTRNNSSAETHLDILEH